MTVNYLMECGFGFVELPLLLPRGKTCEGGKQKVGTDLHNTFQKMATPSRAKLEQKMGILNRYNGALYVAESNVRHPARMQLHQDLGVFVPGADLHTVETKAVMSLMDETSKCYSQIQETVEIMDNNVVLQAFDDKLATATARFHQSLSEFRQRVFAVAQGDAPGGVNLDADEVRVQKFGREMGRAMVNRALHQGQSKRQRNIISLIEGHVDEMYDEIRDLTT